MTGIGDAFRPFGKDYDSHTHCLDGIFAGMKRAELEQELAQCSAQMVAMQATIDSQAAQLTASQQALAVSLAAERTAREEEREACAKLCDGLEQRAWANWKRDADMRDHGISDGAEMCAQEIRARGKAGNDEG